MVLRKRESQRETERQRDRATERQSANQYFELLCKLLRAAQPIFLKVRFECCYILGILFFILLGVESHYISLSSLDWCIRYIRKRYLNNLPQLCK